MSKQRCNNRAGSLLFKPKLLVHTRISVERIVEYHSFCFHTVIIQSMARPIDNKFYILIFWFYVTDISICQNIGNTVTTTTAQGTIRGRVIQLQNRNLAVYLGVPYATPPLGNLRFQVQRLKKFAYFLLCSMLLRSHYPLNHMVESLMPRRMSLPHHACNLVTEPCLKIVFISIFTHHQYPTHRYYS